MNKNHNHLEIVSLTFQLVLSNRYLIFYFIDALIELNEDEKEVEDYHDNQNDDLIENDEYNNEAEDDLLWNQDFGTKRKRPRFDSLTNGSRRAKRSKQGYLNESM